MNNRPPFRLRIARGALCAWVLAAGLAAGGPAARMAPIVALAWVFALARLAFWIGYLAATRLRAPGMAATFAVNLATLISAIWVWLA